MTKKPAAPPGFIRDTTGVLVWQGSGLGQRISYKDPGEAIFSHYAGTLKPRCNERTFGMWQSGPCDHKPKHDPDANGRPTKCGHHSAAAKAKRAAKKEETHARWHRQWDARSALHAAELAVEKSLRQIAKGHNDPRTLAQETLAALDAARAESDAANAKG